MKKSAKALLLAAGLSLFAAPAAYAQVDTKESVQPIKVHAPGQYQDIKGHFAAPSIEHLTDEGMLVKKGDANFNPDAKIDRAELKDMVKKAFGKDVQDANANTPFVTRAEIAQWLVDTMPAFNTGVNGGSDVNPYSDISALDAKQKEALRALYYAGLMVGDGQGHFQPNSALSRGEAAALIDRSLSRTLGSSADASFDLVKGDLPETVQTVVNENQSVQGIYTVVDGDARYIVVAGGEVPTTGYSVSVDKVSETAAGYFIQASVHAPDPSLMQGQLVSYPHVVLKMKDAVKPAYLFTAE